MGIVSNRHRHGRSRASADDYAKSLSAISGQLERLGWVDSLIVCGSFVKGSLVPGWSDLDLVVVYGGGLTQDRIEEARNSCFALANPTIPVGMDYVSRAQLLEIRRVVGRPLAMTFELREYAQSAFGANPFSQIESRPDDHAEVCTESELLVRAVANSWLRQSIAGYSSPKDRAFDATKTLLRIAMFESSPLPKSEFRVSDYCSAVRGITRLERISRAFTAAEETRRAWPKIVEQDNGLETTALQLIEEALIYYCEEWIPSW